MQRRHLSSKSQSAARLGSELSAVINRIRSAFGPISMRGPADQPKIKRAEQAVDQTARQLLRGEADLRTWYRVLHQYEDTWMVELAALRGARARGDVLSRCAA